MPASLDHAMRCDAMRCYDFVGVVESIKQLRPDGPLHSRHDCVGFWGDWTHKCLSMPTPMGIYRFEWPLLKGSYLPSMPSIRLTSPVSIPSHGTADTPQQQSSSTESFEEAAFLHIFDWKKAMAYFIGHNGANHARAFEVKHDDVGLTIHSSLYHVADDNDVGGGGQNVQDQIEQLEEVLRQDETGVEAGSQVARAEAAADAEVLRDEEINLEKAHEAAKRDKQDSQMQESAAKEESSMDVSIDSSSWKFIAPNVPPRYVPSQPRTKVCASHMIAIARYCVFTLTSCVA